MKKNYIYASFSWVWVRIRKHETNTIRVSGLTFCFRACVWQVELKQRNLFQCVQEFHTAPFLDLKQFTSTLRQIKERAEKENKSKEGEWIEEEVNISVQRERESVSLATVLARALILLLCVPVESFSQNTLLTLTPLLVLCSCSYLNLIYFFSAFLFFSFLLPRSNKLSSFIILLNAMNLNKSI